MSACFAHASSVTGNKIYVIGGINTMKTHSDIYSFDIDAHVWSKIEMSNKGPMPLYGHSAGNFV